jgi:hypothetical protein
MNLPKYPEEFFDFGDGVNITHDEINKTIKRLVNEILGDKECYGMSSSTGNTKVSVSKNIEDGELIIEVFKNYHRKYVNLEDLNEQD